MRFAILSDIHSNLQAWEAVFLDIRSYGIERIICLGDVVGYGPNPSEVLQRVHAAADHLVLGNHDAVICGKLDADLFNPAARRMIDWTRNAVGSNAAKFLGSFPLSIDAGVFRCAHSGFANPAAFDYVIEPADALRSWRTVRNQLLFIGHTHIPALFVLGQSGTPHMIEPQDFQLEPGKRYIVNTGSVGQPRDGDARASYCIYDAAQSAVFWRRVPFDLDAYRRALEGAGIPAETCAFLHHDPRLGRPPLRELLDFAPPTTADKQVRNVVEVQEISTLKRRVRTWRLVSAAFLCIAIATLSAAGAAAWCRATRSLILPDPDARPIESTAIPANETLLHIPGVPVPAGSAIPGWTVSLGNKRRQQAAVIEEAGGEHVLRLVSTSMDDDISISSPAIAVKPAMAFYPDALFRKSADFTGTVALAASLIRQGKGGQETSGQFYVKEPNQVRPDGWIRARQRFDIPAGGMVIQYYIRGRFTGTVEVKDISLTHH